MSSMMMCTPSPRRWRVLLAAAAGGLTTMMAGAAQPQVGVSVEISQPGVYGRIDIGNRPQPPVVYAPQPVVIAPVRVEERRVVEPVYLWVPPGHRQNWGRYCREYRACGVPVYFVRDDWYQDNVHRGEGRHGGHHGRRDDRRRGGDDDRGDRGDRGDREDDRGGHHGRREGR